MGEELQPFRHVWLYAKDWYEQGDDPWKDLKKIISMETAMMREESVTDELVIDVVVNIVLIAMAQSGNTDHTLRRIYSSLFPGIKHPREDEFHNPQDHVLLELLKVILMCSHFLKWQKQSDEVRADTKA